MKKKPNRLPNAVCQICHKPFYGSPSSHRVTCSLDCRTVYYRSIGNLLEGAPKGEKNPRWAGGRWLHQEKYWLVLKPDHPHADRHGYVREHRLIMEEYLGRYLDPKEVVHHKNGNPMDNRIENLELFQSNGEHKSKGHPHNNSSE